MNLNDSPKWIDNSKFREYELKIFKENNNQFNEENIYNYFDYIIEDNESNLLDSNSHERTKGEEVEKLFCY